MSRAAGTVKTAAEPRLGFVGPHLGRHPGWVVTQSEILADLFSGEGYEVRTTSSVENPRLRVADMLRSLVTWRALGQVDVIVLSVFSGRAFRIADVVSRTAQLLSLPQVHVLRGGGLPDQAVEEPDRVRRVLARAQAIVAPSPFLARTSADLGLVADVIPNVLDLGRYDFAVRPIAAHRSEEPLRLLWLRTFHSIYRPQIAVEVLHALQQRGITAELTLAGQDKGLEETCRKRAAELGLEGRVRFPGFLDSEGKRRELAAHDVYLHTNAVDNTPVTVLEAAASGLPIVATAVGGLPDLIDHGRSGLLVDDGPDLVQHLTDAVLCLRDEPDLAERLSLGGRELAERCAWTRVLELWRGLLGRVQGRV